MPVASRNTVMTLSTALLTATRHDIVNKYNHENKMMLRNLLNMSNTQLQQYIKTAHISARLKNLLACIYVHHQQSRLSGTLKIPAQQPEMLDSGKSKMCT